MTLSLCRRGMTKVMKMGMRMVRALHESCDLLHHAQGLL